MDLKIDPIYFLCMNCARSLKKRNHKSLKNWVDKDFFSPI